MQFETAPQPALLLHKRVVENPTVLIPDPELGDEWENKSPKALVTATLKGSYWQVWPQTIRDVRFLCSLDHHQQKWASAEQDGGTIVKLNLLHK
jgi:hypothetical protein